VNSLLYNFLDIIAKCDMLQRMHIITRKRLLESAKKHPDCNTALESWHRILKHTKFNSFAELKQTFPSADQVGKLAVFNTGANKAHLIAAIHYNRSRVYIRHVLTHKEYDQGICKKK
jgi:mRNA interferase HigB